MTHWEKIWSFCTPNITISCDVAPEEESPHGAFDDDGEAERMIENGELDWFMVRVRVLKCGVELSVDYLGGCAYRNATDFVSGENRDGYFRDMVREAIADARKKLVQLAA